MNKTYRAAALLSIFGAFLCIQACTSSSPAYDPDFDDDTLLDTSILDSNTPVNKDNKITIRWYGNNAEVLQFDPLQYFNKIKQAFPIIEIQRYQEQPTTARVSNNNPTTPWQTAQLDKMLSTNVQPDLIVAYAELIPTLDKLGLLSNMDDYAASNKLDLDRFDPVFLNQVRAYSPDNQLLAVPYSRTLHAMSYNKDWFDKFNIPYPTDGMMWEEWIPWSERIEAALGDNPLGHSISFGYPLLAAQRSTAILNADTGKAELTNGNWSSILRVLQHYPNNVHTPFALFNYNVAFMSHDLAALSLDNSVQAVKFISSLIGDQYWNKANWDMVSFPTFQDTPGIGPDFVGEVVAVNPKGEHPAEAFELLSYLVSDEFQTYNARMGLGSPLANPDVNGQFAVENDYYKGKNVRAFFYNRPAEPAKTSPREQEAAYMMNTVVDRLNRTTNVDTELQQLERLLNR